jgi:hypothetical protein
MSSEPAPKADAAAPASALPGALAALALAAGLLLGFEALHARWPWLRDHTKAPTFWDESEGEAPPAEPVVESAPTVKAADPEIVRSLFADLAAGRRRRIRVLYFADSLIESGVLTDTLRADLQGRYGGKGPGYQGISPWDAGDRRDVTLRPGKEWRRSGPNEALAGGAFALGPSGEGYTLVGSPIGSLGVFPPAGADGAWYDGARFFSGPGDFDLAGRSGAQTFNLRVRGRAAFNAVRLPVPAGGAMALRVRPDRPDTVFYGISLDSPEGVQVDACALRGNLGDGPSKISDAVLRAAQKEMGWDLVVLEFGLNVLDPAQKSFAWYRADVRHTLRHLKDGLPGARFAVVSVIDHAVKGPRGMLSDPSIPKVMDAQARAAADEGAVFFDLYHAMGGPGTMARWVEQEPQCALRDYMHPNRRGGVELAHLLEGMMLPDRGAKP